MSWHFHGDLPDWLKLSVDLGYYSLQDGELVRNKDVEHDSVPGMARIIEKIKPELAKTLHTSYDQEAIVLSRVLTSTNNEAREKWAILRQALGMPHGKVIPARFWSTKAFQAVANEIDQIYLGHRTSKVLSPDVLIDSYQGLVDSLRRVSVLEFSQHVGLLSDPATLDKYGEKDSEWEIAIDVLRVQRINTRLEEAWHNGELATMGGMNAEKIVKYMRDEINEIEGYMIGDLNATDRSKCIADVFGVNSENPGLLDNIANFAKETPHYTTGIEDIDADMEGGIRHISDKSEDGRTFVLAARTGVGKTVIGASIAAKAAVQGCKTAYLSIELGHKQIEARMWSALTYHLTMDGHMNNKIKVPALMAPEESQKERIMQGIMEGSEILRNIGGDIKFEAPWQSDVDTVCTALRLMKAKDPDLRFAVIDHFHCMGRHKGAPRDEHAMMEERAYKLQSVTKELGIDLLVLAQMNRIGMDNTADPTLDQIRGTDALSHVAHAVWIVRKSKDQAVNFDNKTQLELHHVKRRGAQAIWRMRNDKLYKDYPTLTAHGTLTMEYEYSAVKSNTFR